MGLARPDAAIAPATMKHTVPRSAPEHESGSRSSDWGEVPKLIQGQRRATPLKNAKSSTEELRKRMRGGDGGVDERRHTGRAGRQFTVGNVGNNGLIYLRYSPVRAPPGDLVLY